MDSPVNRIFRWILLIGIFCLIHGTISAQNGPKPWALFPAQDSGYFLMSVGTGTVIPGTGGAHFPDQGRVIYMHFPDWHSIDTFFVKGDSICLAINNLPDTVCVELPTGVTDTDTRIDSFFCRNDTFWGYKYNVIGATVIDSLYAYPGPCGGGSGADSNGVFDPDNENDTFRVTQNFLRDNYTLRGRSDGDFTYLIDSVGVFQVDAWSGIAQIRLNSYFLGTGSNDASLLLSGQNVFSIARMTALNTFGTLGVEIDGYGKFGNIGASDATGEYVRVDNSLYLNSDNGYYFGYTKTGTNLPSTNNSLDDVFVVDNTTGRWYLRDASTLGDVDTDTRVDSIFIRNDTLWAYIYDVLAPSLLDSIFVTPFDTTSEINGIYSYENNGDTAAVNYILIDSLLTWETLTTGGGYNGGIQYTLNGEQIYINGDNMQGGATWNSSVAMLDMQNFNAGVMGIKLWDTGAAPGDGNYIEWRTNTLLGAYINSAAWRMGSLGPDFILWRYPQAYSPYGIPLYIHASDGEIESLDYGSGTFSSTTPDYLLGLETGAGTAGFNKFVEYPISEILALADTNGIYDPNNEYRETGVDTILTSNDLSWKGDHDNVWSILDAGTIDLEAEASGGNFARLQLIANNTIANNELRLRATNSDGEYGFEIGDSYTALRLGRVGGNPHIRMDIAAGIWLEHSGPSIPSYGFGDGAGNNRPIYAAGLDTVLAITPTGAIYRTTKSDPSSERADIIIVDDIPALEAVQDTGNYAFVRDSLTGGYFERVDSIQRDSAFIWECAETGKSWRRIVPDGVVWLTWYLRTDSSWTDVLQRAVDTVSNHNTWHTVYLPYRDTVYYLDTAGADPYDPDFGAIQFKYCVELKSNVHLLADVSTVITLPDSLVPYGVDSVNRINIFIADSVENVIVEGGIWDGNAEMQYRGIDSTYYYGQNTYGNYFTFYSADGTYDCKNIEFKNNWIRNHSGNPVNFKSVDGMRCYNMRVSDVGEGFITHFSKNIDIQNYHIWNTYNLFEGDGLELLETSGYVNGIRGDSLLTGSLIDVGQCHDLFITKMYSNKCRGGITLENSNGDSIVQVILTDFVIDSAWNNGIDVGENCRISNGIIAESGVGMKFIKLYEEVDGSPIQQAYISNVQMDSCGTGIVITDSLTANLENVSITNSTSRAIFLDDYGSGNGAPTLYWNGGIVKNNGTTIRLGSIAGWIPKVRIQNIVWDDNTLINPGATGDVSDIYIERLKDTILQTSYTYQLDSIFQDVITNPIGINSQNQIVKTSYAILADTLDNYISGAADGDGLFDSGNHQTDIGGGLTRFEAQIGAADTLEFSLNNNSSIFEITDNGDQGSLVFKQQGTTGIRAIFNQSDGSPDFRMNQNGLYWELHSYDTLDLQADGIIRSYNDHKFAGDIIDFSGTINPAGYILIGQGSNNGSIWVDTTGLFGGSADGNGLLTESNSGSYFGTSPGNDNMVGVIKNSDTLTFQFEGTTSEFHLLNGNYLLRFDPASTGNKIEAQNSGSVYGLLNFDATGGITLSASGTLDLNLLASNDTIYGNSDAYIIQDGQNPGLVLYEDSNNERWNFNLIGGDLKLDGNANAADFSINKNAEILQGLKDKDGDLGSAGNILMSTGTQVNWVDTTGLFGGGGGSSEWTRSGNLIYPNNTTDSVGIGLTAPDTKFHVLGSSLVSKLEASGTSGTNFLYFENGYQATGVMQGIRFWNQDSDISSGSLLQVASIDLNKFNTSSGGTRMTFEVQGDGSTSLYSPLVLEGASGSDSGQSAFVKFQGGVQHPNQAQKNSNYTLQDGDYTAYRDDAGTSGITYTVPDDSGCDGCEFVVSNINSSGNAAATITVTLSGSDVFISTGSASTTVNLGETIKILNIKTNYWAIFD